VNSSNVDALGPVPPEQAAVAIAGCSAQAPGHAPPGTVLHLMHGDQGRVVPMALAIDGASAQQALDGSVQLDKFPGLGHGLGARVARRIQEPFEEPATPAPPV
jgi:predicted esterase